MANYFGNLIQRNQPTNAAIRPIVAPLFAPVAPQLDLGADQSRLTLDDELSTPSVRGSSSKSLSPRVAQQSVESEVDKERQSSKTAVQRSQLRSIDGGSPAQPIIDQRNPAHLTKTDLPTELHEAVSPASRIESRTFERVIQTSDLAGRSDVQLNQLATTPSELRLGELPHRAEPVRPRIDSYVPPTAAQIGKSERSGEADGPPTIRVTIGRVDVKLVTDEKVKRPATAKQERRLALALDDYLHKGGERL